MSPGPGPGPAPPRPGAGGEGGKGAQVFAGLRVLDLARSVPGEYCAKLFGDFGADVVKVERPIEGSLTCRGGAFPGGVSDPESSALFLALNTNKRSITIDLATAQGRELFLQLAERADLVVESFRPGTLEGLGLSYERLRTANPSLILTRISNFGQDGPRRDDEASALVLEALGGPMFSTGGVGRPPLRKPGNLSMYVVGRAAALASLAALTARRRSGRGAMLDVSAYEVLLGGADRRAPYLQTALYSGAEAPRGIRSPHRPLSISPAGPFSCKDGFVMLYVTEGFFPRLLEMLGDPDLAAELTEALDRFHTRGEGDEDALRRRFLDVLEPWLAARSKHEIMELAEARHIPITAILSVGEVLENEHYRERGVFVEAEHPVAGRLAYAGRPWQMRGGWALRSVAPTLGQHTAEILAELGRREEIGALAAAGVV